MKHTPGKIFLAEQRGLIESPYFRRFCTFQFGQFQAEDKEAFGPLQALNEEMLGGGQQLDFPVREAAFILVLPLTGAVRVRHSSSAAVTVEVGELQILSVAVESQLTFENPYASETIHFLQLWVKASLTDALISGGRFPFDLSAQPNCLMDVLAPDGLLPFKVNLGQFAGRVETVYRLGNPQARFFAFVLAGAFEVEGRLLHPNDGLALWDTTAVELEALSQDAVVLILEVPA